MNFFRSKKPNLDDIIKRTTLDLKGYGDTPDEARKDLIHFLPAKNEWRVEKDKIVKLGASPLILYFCYRFDSPQNAVCFLSEFCQPVEKPFVKSEEVLVNVNLGTSKMFKVRTFADGEDPRIVKNVVCVSEEYSDDFASLEGKYVDVYVFKLSKEKVPRNVIVLSKNVRGLLGVKPGDDVEVDFVPESKIPKVLLCTAEIKTGDKVKKVALNRFESIYGTCVTPNIPITYRDNGKICSLVFTKLFGEGVQSLEYGIIDQETEIQPGFALPQTFDFQSIGVGGIGEQFQELFRRLLLSRVISPSLKQKMGLTDVKGAILHGPPGTGKTRLARQMANLLEIPPERVSLVNGPDILGKFVGESETNIRNRFAIADNFPEELCILIIDEIDSVVSRRRGDSNVHYDKIVNQFLTEIDGYKQRNNLIIFGFTNRLELLDEALLRPGRLEIHIKIDLPDLRGREEIFQIHMKGLIENKLLEPKILENIPGFLTMLASKSEGLSGAAIEATVKSATQLSLSSKIDYKDLKSISSLTTVEISQDDFFRALESQNLKEERDGPWVVQEMVNPEIALEMVKHVAKERIKSVMLVTGKPRSGKTSTIGHFWSLTPSSKSYFNSKDYLKRNTKDLLYEAFAPENEYVILDDLDHLLDCVPNVQFSNSTLQTLKGLLNTTLAHVVLCVSNSEKYAYLGIFDQVTETFIL